MSRRSRLSSARLRPPRIPRGAVPRPELVTRLLDALQGAAVTVAAGAGYGKTTLLAMTARADVRPWAWCPCDSRIRDSYSLAGRIAASVDVAYPGFDAALDLSEASPLEMAELLGEATFEITTEDFVLAVDDLHLVGREADELLKPLLDSLPDHVHLLLASREALPLSARALALLDVQQFSEEHLRFSDDEAHSLIRAFGPELPDNERSRVVDDAEGWAAGLVLGARAGAIVTGADVRFDYLAEEVVSAQPATRQDFLMRTAVCSRFSPDLAGFLTGQPDPGQVAKQLISEHLFTVRVDSHDEWYRYHHLFKAFLNERYRAKARDEWVVTHQRAADWWARAGEPVEVVRHLVACSDYERAAAYLEPVVEDLIQGSDAELVVDWLKVIGGDTWSRRPGLVAANAALLLNRAEHEEAFEEFDRAIEFFATEGDAEQAAALTVRLQQAMLAAGTQPERRIALGERAIARLDNSARMLPPARMLLASAYGYGCRFEEARQQLEVAEGLPAFDDSVQVMADVVRAFYIDFWQAQPLEALSTISASRLALSERRAPDPLGLYPVAAMLEAYVLLELGYFEDVAAISEQIHTIWEQAGMGRRTVRRANQWVRSALYVGLGDWAQLEEWVLDPPKASGRVPATSYTYRYRVPAALLSAAKGRTAQAETQIRACAIEMDRFGATFDRPAFLCDLARASRMAGNDRLAAELSKKALADALEIESPWASVRSRIWVATTDPLSRNECIDDALRLTEQFRLDAAWSHRERENARPLLSLARNESLGPPGAAGALLERLAGAQEPVESFVAVASIVRPWSNQELEHWIGRLDAGGAEIDSRTLAEQARSLEQRMLGSSDWAGRAGDLAVRFLLSAAAELERRDDLEHAIGCYKVLVESPAASEGWHRALMGLLSRAGEVDAATRQYHVLRARLQRDRGAVPGRETEDLYATLLLSREGDIGDQPDRPLTVVFTDIVGSTEIASRLGDRRWATLVANHEELLSAHAVEFGGRVVKTQGDGGMFAFPNVEGAVGFAGSVQRSLSSDVRTSPKLSIRVGINRGDAVRHGDDYLGRTVIIAARLTDAGSAGDVLVADSVKQAVSEGVFEFIELRRLGLKGLEGEHSVWSLRW